MTKRKCKRCISQRKLTSSKKRRTHSKTNSLRNSPFKTNPLLVDMHYFEYLPLEILHHILDFLSVNELRTFASVSELFAKWTLDYLRRITVIKERFNLSKLYCPTQGKIKDNHIVRCTVFSSLSCRLKVHPKLNSIFDSLGRTWAEASYSLHRKEKFKLLTYVLKILVSTLTDTRYYKCDRCCFFYIACAKFIDKFTSKWSQEEKLKAFEHIVEFDYFRNRIKSVLFNPNFPISIEEDNYEILHIRHFFRDVFLDHHEDIELGNHLLIALKSWPIFIQARLVFMLYASPKYFRDTTKNSSACQIRTDEVLLFGETFKCLKLAIDNSNYKFQDDDWISLLWDIREAASEEWFEKYLPMIIFNAGEQVYNTYITTKLTSGRIQEACSLVISLIVLLWEDNAPERSCKAWLSQFLKTIKQELPDRYNIFIADLFDHLRNQITINAFPTADYRKGLCERYKMHYGLTGCLIDLLQALLTH